MSADQSPATPASHTPKMPKSWFHGSSFAMPLYGLQYGPDREPQASERVLGPYLLPAFQRPGVWTPAQEVALLESLWAGLPIGSLVYNRLDANRAPDGWLLDGQQRVTAITRYLSGAFPVHGYRFTELEKPEQRGFLMKSIPAVETRMKSVEQCLDVYRRLAYGGTAHAEEHRV